MSKKTNDARVGNPQFGGDYQKAANIRSIEAVIFDKLSKASKANKEQFAILSINLKGDGQYAVTASFKPWRAPQSEWYKKTIMVSGPKAVFGEDKQTINKTNDAAKTWDITERMMQGQFAADAEGSANYPDLQAYVNYVASKCTKKGETYKAKLYDIPGGIATFGRAIQNKGFSIKIENPYFIITKDAKFGEWSKPAKGPDQTKVRFYREMKNGKVVGIKEIWTASGGITKVEIPVEEVNRHLSKDARPQFAKYYVAQQGDKTLTVESYHELTGRVKYHYVNWDNQSESRRECSEKEFKDFINAHGFKPAASKMVHKLKRTNSWDADTKATSELKYKLRHKLMGEHAGEKSLKNLLSGNGFSSIQHLGGYSFKGVNSKGLKMGVTYEPIDSDKKEFKVKEIWFEDAKPTSDAGQGDPKSLTTKEIYAELKTHPDKSRETALMNELKRRSDADRRNYEGLANYMNGDAAMSGANYRPTLDEAARAKTNDAGERKWYTWLTMFFELAEKVKNYANINLGVRTDVSKPGSYYRLMFHATPEEMKKIDAFIAGHTIHEKR